MRRRRVRLSRLRTRLRIRRLRLRRLRANAGDDLYGRAVREDNRAMLVAAASPRNGDGSRASSRD